MRLGFLFVHLRIAYQLSPFAYFPSPENSTGKKKEVNTVVGLLAIA